MGGAALLRCGVGESRGLAVELVDGGGPPGQWRIIGVEGLQVVDVAQQVSPAALLGAVVVVIGGIEVADQHAGEGLVQYLVYHSFVPATAQEVALSGVNNGSKLSQKLQVGIEPPR